VAPWLLIELVSIIIFVVFIIFMVVNADMDGLAEYTFIGLLLIGKFVENYHDDDLNGEVVSNADC
jgi:hypothetical protein